MLIIPKTHYACYGEMPQGRDSEFLALKEEVRSFLTEHYESPVFLEHGVIGQTVHHAHLHALPAHQSILTFLLGEPEFTEIGGIRDLRLYYRAHGRYFYYEENGHTYVMAPSQAHPGQLHAMFADVLSLKPGARPDAARSRAANQRVIAAWASAQRAI